MTVSSWNGMTIEFKITLIVTLLTVLYSCGSIKNTVYTGLGVME